MKNHLVWNIVSRAQCDKYQYLFVLMNIVIFIPFDRISNFFYTVLIIEPSLQVNIILICGWEVVDFIILFILIKFWKSSPMSVLRLLLSSCGLAMLWGSVFSTLIFLWPSFSLKLICLYVWCLSSGHRSGFNGVRSKYKTRSPPSHQTRTINHPSSTNCVLCSSCTCGA